MDYITINRDGISVIELGSAHRRSITSDNGDEHMLHSLESVNYLKIDPNNFLEF